jgi:RNA polymerase sigma-70 factor (ECF subfamily)
MGESENTRWSLIRGAAEGKAAAREAFARLYEPVVRAYLAARWRGRPILGEVDDAVQDVFVDCMREPGPLHRADSQFPGGFRAFLRGVTRNIARRHEDKHVHRREVAAGDRFDLGAVEGREEALSRTFDRAWGRALVREAAALQAERAQGRGEAANRRVKLLRLRFGEGLPIREIAKLWNEPAAKLHTDYARAREEFEAALREILRAHHPDREVDEECVRLLGLFG